MAITLQSSIDGFSAEFMRRLPQLEQAMVAHGLEPSEFVISKDRAAPGAPWIQPFFYSYTVFVGEENFTITEPNDIRFLGYFYNRCIAQDNLGDNLEDNAEDNVDPEPAPRPGLINRVFRWMTQPV